jgi:hypothetical protein
MKQLLAFKLDDISLGSGQGTIGTTYSSSGNLISTILKFSLTAAGIILIGLLIFGGITFIMNAGSGDAKKAQQGKSAVTNALIGFAIVILAYTIIQIIEVITGLNILKSTL